jgi:beta-lactamase class A
MVARIWLDALLHGVCAFAPGVLVLFSLIRTVGAQDIPTSQTNRLDSFNDYVLTWTNAVEPRLQERIEAVDDRLRQKFGIASNETAVGLLDLRNLRLAMIRPDHEEYAASVAKIGILLAYFQIHPEAATNLDAATLHDLGMMAKISSNEKAAQFSRQLGLKKIQEVLDQYHFYDTNHGGGIWVGKHYGQGAERIGSPVANNSHAVTIRQLLRYFLMLEQGRLVSPQASKTMREIFASPALPHDDIKFVKGLAGRDVQIIRKWGTWENWYHDVAVISGPERQYILAALTHHTKGDEYLVALAREVDGLMSSGL